MKPNLIFLFFILRHLKSQQLLGTTCNNCQQPKPILVDLEDRIHYGVYDRLTDNVPNWTPDPPTVVPPNSNNNPGNQPQSPDQQIRYIISTRETINPPKTNYYYINIDNNQKSVYLKTLEDDISDVQKMIQQSYNQQQNQYLQQLLNRLNRLYDLLKNYNGQQKVIGEAELLKIKLLISDFKNQMSQDYTQKLIKRYQDLLNNQQNWQEQLSNQYENYQKNIQKQQQIFQTVIREKQILESQITNDSTAALQEQSQMYVEIIEKQRTLIDQLLQEIKQSQAEQKQQNQNLTNQNQQRQQLLNTHKLQNQSQNTSLAQLFQQFFEDRQQQIQRIEKERLEIWQQYMTRIETEKLNETDQQQIIQQLQEQTRRMDVLIQTQQLLLTQQQQNSGGIPNYLDSINRYLQNEYQRLRNVIQQTIQNQIRNPNQGQLTKQELENLLQQQKIVLEIYTRYTNNSGPSITDNTDGASKNGGSSTVTITSEGRQIRPTQDLYRALYGSEVLPSTVGAQRQYTVLPTQINQIQKILLI